MSPKIVHFAPSDTILGFAADPILREDNPFFELSVREIIESRKEIKKQRRENRYSLFENDPEFAELEKITNEITRQNIAMLQTLKVGAEILTSVQSTADQ